MSRRNTSPWLVRAASNDNVCSKACERGKQTHGRAIICDLPINPGTISGEVELLAQFFDQIVDEFEAANDNLEIGKD